MKKIGGLKYCKTCKLVWEIGIAGSVRRYAGMPTYGLPRIDCRIHEKNAKSSLIENER